MQRRAAFAVLIGCSLLACAGAAGSPQEAVPFSRVYKVGEKTTYVVTHAVTFAGLHTMSVEVDLTVKKLLDEGRAQVLAHFSNFRSSDANDTTKIPADLTLQTTANNMPAKFTPTNGSVDILLPMLFLAASTADKPVKAGDEIPFSWDCEAMGLHGSTKIVEIDATKKVLKTLVKTKVSIQGTDSGEFTFNSTFDLADCSLASSKGDFTVAGLKQDLTFTRKER